MADNFRRELIDYLQSNGPTCLATLCQDGRPLSARRLQAAGLPKWDKFILMHVPDIKTSLGAKGEIMLRYETQASWPPLEAIPQLLGAQFLNPEALQELLQIYQTNPNEIQRLAFVADARLSFIAAARLCQRNPLANVGQLTKWRSVYTSNINLATVLNHQELTCVARQGQQPWHREGTFVEAMLEKFALYREYCDFIEIIFSTELPPWSSQ
jgi:hypothetical protein